MQANYIKTLYGAFEKAHEFNIKSLKDLMILETGDTNLIDFQEIDPLNKFDFAFRIGTDKYLLSFSMTRNMKAGKYITYKITRNMQSFGSFIQTEIKELSIHSNSLDQYGHPIFNFDTPKEYQTDYEGMPRRYMVIKLGNFAKEYFRAVFSCE